MKTILYMAITANGYIARKNDETPWSKEEWESFFSKVKEAKNIVLGRKTFEMMKSNGNLAEIGDIFIVVVSDKIKNKSDDTNCLFVNSPGQAVESLKEKGFVEAFVAGGGILNSSFMKQGLVDEIYLDIEPFVFGDGVRLFSENDFEENLELLAMKKLSKNVIQLHYRVIK